MPIRRGMQNQEASILLQNQGHVMHKMYEETEQNLQWQRTTKHRLYDSVLQIT